MIEGSILRFHCQTSSAFHSTRQRYANLVKCAPFILGSTLRGALLDMLIRTRCSSDLIARLNEMDDPGLIAEQHRQCPHDCPAKILFADPPLARFSFARFQKPELQMITRIGLSRETHSVSEGSIFTMEAIAPGTLFDFEIILLDEAQQVSDIVLETMERVAELGSLGGFRSIGLGRFKLMGQPESIPLDDRLYDVTIGWPMPGQKARWTFISPYVLGVGQKPESLLSQAFAHRVSSQIDQVAIQAGYEVDGVLPLTQVDVQLKPDFVGRFSFERGLRENRLIALDGSSLAFDWPETVDEQALALAAALGIGEWAEWGFGRFEVAPADA